MAWTPRKYRMSDNGNGAAPKPYSKPELVMLGNLAALTKALGGTRGANDMGGGNDKTGF
jgi:hypothetical protein